MLSVSGGGGGVGVLLLKKDIDWDDWDRLVCELLLLCFFYCDVNEGLIQYFVHNC